jgi:hypothetical protein
MMNELSRKIIDFNDDLLFFSFFEIKFSIYKSTDSYIHRLNERLFNQALLKPPSLVIKEVDILLLL